VSVHTCSHATIEAGCELQGALARLDASGPITEWGEAVVEAFVGSSRVVFRALDESPGFFGYEVGGEEWHWKLRQVRNHLVLGKRLFAVLGSA